MLNCLYCKQELTKDSIASQLLIAADGGDVCGWDGGNEPHVAAFCDVCGWHDCVCPPVRNKMCLSCEWWGYWEGDYCPDCSPVDLTTSSKAARLKE